jgi:hypothetical protein
MLDLAALAIGAAQEVSLVGLALVRARGGGYVNGFAASRHSMIIERNGRKSSPISAFLVATD